MCRSDVEMKTWSRPRAAAPSASPASSMSRSWQRASAAMTGRRISAAISLHAPEVALGRGGEAGLHDVHAERVELPGESELLLGRETVAGRLLAVAQGGVEDQDVGDRHTSGLG